MYYRIRSRHRLQQIDLDTLAAMKPSGREKGSPAYSVDEHVALLSVGSEVPDTFNCS